MKYKLIVKQIDLIEVEAASEEEAVTMVETSIKQQDPRALIEIVVAEEITI